MKQRPKIFYTESDKSLMWDRWQKGESLNSIARLFGRHHSAIQGILARSGHSFDYSQRDIVTSQVVGSSSLSGRVWSYSWLSGAIFINQDLNRNHVLA
jgi:hypothetical protein